MLVLYEVIMLIFKEIQTEVLDKFKVLKIQITRAHKDS